ncbi:uncharacterized protein LOC106378464 [Brassica napus]|uniref:uncharacterized protein LOC106308625 n=2 Tax=Brassica oleracea var. oleracea TaxID=109376 RepID=UPI0006A6D710|nr:PREDICTED: uncharacterized protein LOC106308625 [Brassica oleracea var. oleracea]XP_048622730.1 uncharacterized protein LOC106378464 [Brassica napus]
MCGYNIYVTKKNYKDHPSPTQILQISNFGSTLAFLVRIHSRPFDSVIDEEKRESSSEHETQVSNIRWHLAEGGFEEFKLLERLGEGKKATAVIGEVADELGTELVVMSMEAIHSKFIDANLLAEFIPCPVLLLPL